MKKTHETIATIGEWKDKDGKTHKRTLIIGAVFESSTGKLVLKLDALPVTSDWSGWLSLKPTGQTPPA